MIEFRSFLNTDPPIIIGLWQNQTPTRTLSQVLTRNLLDHMVLAKPFFDPEGFIIAFNDSEPAGFIHLGFCPNECCTDVDHSLGILAQLRVSGGNRENEIAMGLWERGREYLISKGAKNCYAGAKFPFSPFYTGLYGGSRIPGIPAEDQSTIKILEQIGFQKSGRVEVMQLNLQGYRAPVSRNQMSVRRQYEVTAIVDPLLTNWWECCTYGWAELFGFRIVNKLTKDVFGRLMFWEIQPLSRQWGMTTMGLVDMQIDEEARNSGLGTFLVTESLRHLAGQGVACVEVQVRESNEPMLRLVERLGFEKISFGTEMNLAL